MDKKINIKLYIFIIILTISFISCSRKKEWDNPLNIKLKVIAQIDNKTLPELKDISGSETRTDIGSSGEIIIFDKSLRKIFIFDKNGNFLISFGKHGRGPGELKSVRTIFCLENKIVVGDVGKMALLLFDYRGNFIDEYIYKRPPFIEVENGKNFLIGKERGFISKDNTLKRRYGVFIFSDSLNIENEIVSKTYDYDPKNIEIVQGDFSLCVDKKGGRIAYSEIGNKDFKILLCKENGEVIEKIELDIKKAILPERIREFFNNLYSDLSKSRPMHVKPISKYTNVIESMCFDSKGNLWVNTVKDNGYSKIILFDSDGELKGSVNLNFHLENIYIYEDILYDCGNIYNNEDLEPVTTIYKIITK